MLTTWLARGLALGLMSLLAACYSTGNHFRVSAVNDLVVGQTTQTEAIQLLQGEPVNYYRQGDGSYLALWVFSKSVLPDGIYIDRELLLEFDAMQRLVAIKKKPAVVTDKATHNNDELMH